jgi:hypothetical protein
MAPSSVVVKEGFYALTITHAIQGLEAFGPFKGKKKRSRLTYARLGSDSPLYAKANLLL